MLHNNPKTDAIRAKLGHPVIDSDGHLTEFLPVAREYINKVGGNDMFNRVLAAREDTFLTKRWYELSEAQRRDEWARRPAFWGSPLKNHGLDLATSLFPDLMYARLDEMGLDFTVLFPGLAIPLQTISNAEVRQALCRGFNEYYADVWGEHPDRMTPVAAIPMHTPAEAIAELEHAVGELGFKAIMMPSWVKRPIPAVVRKHPDMGKYAYWLDFFGIDSEHAYDPVWAKCEALKVVPCFHGAGEAFPMRNSISNMVFNHVGHFASAADALCKALFLGGVTKRFPNLRFLLLEGGVGYARSLLADLVGHWEKRSLEGLARNTDPALFDQELFMRLYRQWGGKLKRDIPADTLAQQWNTTRPGDPTDNFPGLGIRSPDDLRQLFVRSFYFGCEGDDPIAASAFDTKRNPGQVRFKAIYGSDISHWDVPNMSQVLEECYELLENELVTPADFRDFVFGNAVQLWTAVNPDFFNGTRVESDARRYIADHPAHDA